MSQLIIGGLLSTPAPTAPIIEIAFIVLFVIVGVMVEPDYNGMNVRFKQFKRNKSNMIVSFI